MWKGFIRNSGFIYGFDRMNKPMKQYEAQMIAQFWKPFILIIDPIDLDLVDELRVRLGFYSDYGLWEELWKQLQDDYE